MEGLDCGVSSNSLLGEFCVGLAPGLGDGNLCELLLLSSASELGVCSVLMGALDSGPPHFVGVTTESHEGEEATPLFLGFN